MVGTKSRPSASPSGCRSFPRNGSKKLTARTDEDLREVIFGRFAVPLAMPSSLPAPAVNSARVSGLRGWTKLSRAVARHPLSTCLPARAAHAFWRSRIWVVALGGLRGVATTSMLKGCALRPCTATLLKQPRRRGPESCLPPIVLTFFAQRSALQSALVWQASRDLYEVAKPSVRYRRTTLPHIDIGTCG